MKPLCILYVLQWKDVCTRAHWIGIESQNLRIWDAKSDRFHITTTQTLFSSLDLWLPTFQTSGATSWWPLVWTTFIHRVCVSPCSPSVPWLSSSRLAWRLSLFRAERIPLFSKKATWGPFHHSVTFYLAGFGLSLQYAQQHWMWTLSSVYVLFILVVNPALGTDM